MAYRTSYADTFYRKLVKIVETNLQREEFGVRELVLEVGLSRSHIHRKLKSITGQSISQFIREIRLKRAHQLLTENPVTTVSEIAFQVGFSNPTYFNKCFRDYFGYSPGSTHKLENRVLGGTKNDKRTFLLMSFFVGPLIIVALLYLIPGLSPLGEGQSNRGQEYITDTRERSIAVLPFRDDSEGRDNQYFCDGMMDEILNHLQKVSALEVKSRSVVEPYRNSQLGFLAIAQELGVSFILEGAVRKHREHFRITVQLIDAQSGNHLWSDYYDGILSDTIFKIQGNIAKKVALSLNALITPEEIESIDRVSTTDIEAYDLRIRASQEQNLFWQTMDRKHLKYAHELLDRALLIDPNYKRAILTKGEVYVGENNYDSALTYADRLIVIAPDFIGGYGLKGDCYFFKQNNDLAIQNYLKAIDLIPNNEEHWLWYYVALGRAYLAKNEPINALAHIRVGLGLGVDYLPTVYFTIALTYLQVGDYQRATEYLKKCLDMNSSCGAVMIYNWVLLLQGKFQEAVQFTTPIFQKGECPRECSKGLYQAYWLIEDFMMAEKHFLLWEKYKSVDPYFQIHQHELGYLYYQLGRHQESEEIFKKEIEKLKSQLDKGSSLTFLSLARIYSFQGNKKNAYLYLSEYAKLGFDGGWHDFILMDPYFEKLRNDSEFRSIVKRAQDEKLVLRNRIKQMEKNGALDI